jgi:hypothetical protein
MTGELLLHVQNGEYTAAHMSVFPCAQVPEQIEKGQINSRHLFLYDGKRTIYECPCNFGYYMKYRRDPRLQWLPEESILDMLTGKAPIYVVCDMGRLLKENGRIIFRDVGWIDYADKDGNVFSGTYSPFFSVVTCERHGFRDTLLNFKGDGPQGPEKARSCFDKSEEFCRRLAVCGTRADFLVEVAKMVTARGIVAAGACLREYVVENVDCYGKGNVFTEFKEDGRGVFVRFEPL